MRASEFLNELKINNATGLGQVPLNQNVDYQGLQVAMRPSMFLRLALPLNSSDPDEMKTINYIQQHIDEPGIGAPFLNIEIPESWESGEFKELAKVVGHDGRHRMYAVLNHQGDEPVEVHMFPRYLRRRHLTDEIIEHLRNGIVSQQGNYVRGPIFGGAK
jgi:glutathionylspermidine synthase